MTPDPQEYGELLADSAQDLFEHAPCGYLSTAPDGTIVQVNQTFLDWTGHRREDLLGRRRFRDLLTAGGQLFLETSYLPVLTLQGEVREVAFDLVRGDGGPPLPVLVNSAVRLDAGGRPLITRTMVFDATNRRRYERELLLARRRAEESEARARVLARTLQTSLIPPSIPAIPGLDVAGGYRPAGAGDEVGGDFYDVFASRGNDWAVSLGDVCGKGAEAAIVTALARYTLRAAATQARRPRLVLAALNDALLRQEVDRFCTAVYARLRRNRSRWRLTLACGGHPLPVLVRAGQRPPEFVGKPGSALGILPKVDLSDVAVELDPGDAVVCYSDGVTEARRDASFYGEDRLLDLLAGTDRSEPAADLVARLLEDVVGFSGGETRDDVAIVVVKVLSEPGG